MSNKCKIVFLCFVVIVSLLLPPVQSAYAGVNDRSETMPMVTDADVQFIYKEFFDWFGLIEPPEENIVETFLFAFRKNDYLDYSLYDLAFDFDFLTQVDEETYITSEFSTSMDLSNIWLSTIGSILSFDDPDNVRIGFDYGELVKNAEGFEAREIEKKGNYIYNTVISHVDVYFVRKSDGETGQVKRFKFTWDSNLWSQTCKKIEYSWIYNYGDESETDKVVDSVESEDGLNGMNTGSNTSLKLNDNLLDLLKDFFVHIPGIATSLVVGFYESYVAFADFLSVVFPFIPALIFDFFGIVIFISVIIAAYKLIR